MKKNIGAFPLLYPIPIVLIGSYNEDKINFTTIGDLAIMGVKPALITISLLESHLSTSNILLSKTFSVNIPSFDAIAKVDYCGMVSGNDTDKASLFNVFYGEDPKIPLIEECPVNMECEVIKHFIYERRNIFIARINHTWLEDKLAPQSASNSIPSLKDLNPIIYSMDNHYYSIGDECGKGYQEGKKYLNNHLGE
jgi:flavin reductase (DIM6/NTAB) family NADH-FMN oxidoreductase RutF